ncbi:MAG: TetR/AcrR family transcriptional regulator [Phycisphaerae bacterium]
MIGSASSESPSPGTRRAPGAVRERLLDVASELFYRRGFHAVGVDTVIAESGVAKMTLYKYFPSKDDLIVAVLRRRQAQFRAWFAAALARRASASGATESGGIASGAAPNAGVERVLAVFDVLGEWFALPTFRGCAFTNAVLELTDPAHGVHEVNRAHREWLVATLAALVRDAGITAFDDVAAQLVTLIDGAIVQAASTQNIAAAQVARRAATAVLAAAR